MKSPFVKQQVACLQCHQNWHYHDLLLQIFPNFHLGIWLLLFSANFEIKEANAASIAVNAAEEDVRHHHQTRSRRSQIDDVKCREKADERFRSVADTFQSKSEEMKTNIEQLIKDYVSA